MASVEWVINRYKIGTLGLAVDFIAIYYDEAVRPRNTFSTSDDGR